MFAWRCGVAKIPMNSCSQSTPPPGGLVVHDRGGHAFMSDVAGLESGRVQVNCCAIR
jgi:hypothetical protein